MSRGRLALGVALAVLLIAGGWARGCRQASSLTGDPHPRLAEAAAAVNGRLAGALAEAERFALDVRDREGAVSRRSLGSVLASRVEGFGIVQAGAYLTWKGTPAEPQEFGSPGEPVRLLRRGVRTSLLVRTAPDASGKWGAASFVLEIHAGAPPAESLLETGTPAIAARWDLGTAASQAQERFDPGPPASWRVPWRAGHGPVLAQIVLEERSAASLAEGAQARSLAWAALVFAVFLMASLVRRGGSVDGARVLVVSGASLVARAAVAGGRSFEELLPRPLGSASLYGRAGALGWLDSPAALLASAWTLYVILATLARWCAEARPAAKAGARAFAGAGALAGLAASIGLAGSLARDARILVPRLDFSSAGSLVLALALALVVTATAETAVSVIASFRRDRAPGPPGRAVVFAALAPLAIVALGHLHATRDELTSERLRSEFAPLVRDQSARRRVALVASVGEAAASPAVAAALARPAEDDDPFLSYRLWSSSDLFHQGFASSLTLFDAAGARRGHFEFAFPQVGGERESAPRARTAPATPIVEDETVPIGSTLLHVVHAEAAVSGADGRIVGRVVGHVLEDPSNLPFLPGSAPYLEALGRAAAPMLDPAVEAPDYVRYDEEGHVDISTLHQPPAATDELHRAAETGRRVDVVAGDTVYRALAVEEGRRLHLLMTPAPTYLDAAGDAVRLALAALAILAIAFAARLVLRPHGIGALADVVRGSLRRKLLAAGLAASAVPAVGLAFFLRAYIERRGEASLADTAATVVGAAQRVVEDYQSVGEDDPTLPPLRLNDEALSWLRRVVGQEIHLYESGQVAATSKPELFDSGLLLPRLPGEVERTVVREGQPFILRDEKLGAIPLPVVYAPVDVRGGPRDAVISIPLVLEQRAFVRSIDRLVEILLLLTTALVGMLAATSALLARSVAGPVRRLADASRRIAEGDYDSRLTSTSRDEMGSLVLDFNRMAHALAEQRADLERRRDYIEALLRHATTGVVSMDADGAIVTINPAAESLLGVAGDAPRRGSRLDDEIRKNPPLGVLADAVARATPDPVEVDVGAGDRAQRLRLVRVPLPGPAGQPAGSLVLLDDVTGLMKSNQLAAWAEMARAIAHEIKNPLTPIQLSTEHARRLLVDRGVLPSPEIEACLETIGRQVRELRAISSAFSAYAKIPDLAMERLDPRALVRDVLAPYRAAPPEGIRVETELGPIPEILADGRMLSRALVNLVENALQAIPRGEVRVVTRTGGSSEAVVEVRDDGPGLTDEVRRRLFEPYFSTKSSGTGLGLAITRRVVEAHGGTIVADDAPGGGTIFRITLPAAPGR